MMAFIDQEANEKVEEIDAKVCYADIMLHVAVIFLYFVWFWVIVFQAIYVSFWYK